MISLAGDRHTIPSVRFVDIVAFGIHVMQQAARRLSPRCIGDLNLIAVSIGVTRRLFGHADRNSAVALFRNLELNLQRKIGPFLFAE